jgi:hypothetical protein
MKCTWLPRSSTFTPFFVALGIAVEVGRALLELGEVLDRLERALRAEQPLDVDTAQRRRVDAVAAARRADVADRVRRGVGVAVRVAVEARDALVRGERAAVVGRVELLLRERREQQPQALELLRVQDPSNSSWKFASVTSLPFETSPSSGRVVR